MDTILVSIGFFLLLVVLVVVRALTQNKFEVKNNDIALALVLVALVLFQTGEIQKLKFGDFEIERAFREASRSAVAPQVTELPVEPVQMDSKAGIDQIARLIASKAQALSFRMGHGGYWGPAITEYLARLTQYPFFRYVVVTHAGGSFFGIVDARHLAATLANPQASFTAEEFARSLNSSNAKAISFLPGFLGADQALAKNADRRWALQLMDSLDVQALPVFDQSRTLVGMVDRSKLTASMLLDVARRLDPQR